MNEFAVALKTLATRNAHGNYDDLKKHRKTQLGLRCGNSHQFKSERRKHAEKKTTTKTKRKDPICEKSRHQQENKPWHVQNE